MVEKYYELTTPQKSIWNMEKFFEDTTINNICASITIFGELNEAVLKRAIYNIVSKNDSFRTRIIIKDNTPAQYFCAFEPFEIEVINAINNSQFEKIKEDLINYKFKIIDSNLFCFKIVKFPDGHGVLVFTVHHIIADSWSLGLFAKSVMKEYKFLSNNDALREPNYSYAQYVNSELDYVKSEKYQKDKAYWTDLFKSIPEPATFFGSKTLESNHHLMQRRTFYVEPTIAKKINAYCSNNKVSLFNFFMAIYSIYLHRTTALEEFTIGTPILNRTNFKEKETMGMFVNTIPVKINLSNHTMFYDFVHSLKTIMLGNLKHQKFSYSDLLEELRHTNQNLLALYNVVISYQATKAVDKENENYTTDWYGNKHSSADVVIQITDLNDTGEIAIHYDYLIEKYTKEDILSLNSRIFRIIEQVVVEKDLDISNIDIVTEEEENKILNIFNDTVLDYDKNENLLDVFYEQVKKAPKNIAVIFEKQKLTYKELDEKSNILASNLRSFGIKNTDVVAVLEERGLNLIISILGIIKSGATYVLIDTSLPQERIDYILNDSDAKLCICDKTVNNSIYINIKDFISSGIVKNNIPNSSQLENNLCIIYTSGSTGNPKGVLLNKCGFLNLILAYKKGLEIDKYKKILGIATVSFDMFALELFAAILPGNTLVLANEEEQKNIVAMSNLIKKNDIDFMVTTPSRIQMLLLEELGNPLKNVKAIQLGGEKFSSSLYEKLRKVTNAKIFNGYGPTEITACCTNKQVTSFDITIGKPLANVQAYICDSGLKLLPIGAVGEICIGGKRCFKWIFK